MHGDRGTIEGLLLICSWVGEKGDIEKIPWFMLPGLDLGTWLSILGRDWQQAEVGAFQKKLNEIKRHKAVGGAGHVFPLPQSEPRLGDKKEHLCVDCCVWQCPEDPQQTLWVDSDRVRCLWPFSKTQRLLLRFQNTLGENLQAVEICLVRKKLKD